MGSTDRGRPSKAGQGSPEPPSTGNPAGLCLNADFLKLTLPTFFEPSLTVLPRPLLNWMETHALPPIPGRKALTPRRVAVVKSQYCAHIYASPWSGGDLRALALSTLKTFGPLSLFTRHQTDFFIVRLPADPECQVWREFYAEDPDPAASAGIHENVPNYRAPGAPDSSPAQGDFAVDPGSVDWSRYEAVVVQDLCLPEKIVRKFPDVFWSYWIGETGGPSFKASARQALAGYHVFLNGSSRLWRVRPGLRSHVLEFPYILQDSQTHASLGARPWRERSGILLEINTARALPGEVRRRLETIAPVAENIGPPAIRLDQLHRARYFVQMTPKRLWGNSLNEAAAAGCLSLANPESMPNNRSLLRPGLTPRNWEAMLRLLDSLEKRPGWAEAAHRQQQDLADWILGHRPLMEWEKRLDAFRPRKGT